MRVERVVLDTNVLISAVLSPLGLPFGCLGWVLDNATLIVSKELLEELETRLARPKFKKYVDDSRRRAFVAELGLTAVQVELSGVVNHKLLYVGQRLIVETSRGPGALTKRS